MDGDEYVIRKKFIEKNYGPTISRLNKAAFCILGFIRFLKGYYLVLVTKRKRVAKIMRHSIYSVQDMQLIPMFTTTSTQNRDDENRYINYFQQV